MADWRNCCNDAAGHAAEWQRLKPYAAGPAKRREEESFSAKQSGFDAANVFNVVIDGRLKRDETAGIDAQHLTRLKRPFDQHAAGMHERPAVAVQPLHDEAFTAKEPYADPLLKSNSDTHAFCRREKRVLLRDQLAANIGKPDRNDLSGIWRGKGHALPTLCRIHEDRHE